MGKFIKNIKKIRKTVCGQILIVSAVMFLGFFFSIKPVFAQEGTIFLSPQSGSFPLGSDLSVKLMIDTGNALANAAQVKLHFDTDLLEVISISKEGSILALWPQDPLYSNKTGEISLIGGLPQPGFKGAGELINIKFWAKKEGEAVFWYDESNILANDGLGTDILKYIKGTKYLIYSQEKLKTNSPEIFCPTHPNPSEWYSNDSPNFQWNAGGKEVSFILDQKPDTISDEDSEGLMDSKKYDQIADGIWYFHLRFKNNNDWGETSHYQIKIDTKPPRDFEIIIDNKGDITNPSPKVYFETQDDNSGIYKYMVKIGENDFFDLMAAQINFFVPKLNPGNYNIIVKAVDMAHNAVGAKAYLDIKPIETPVITLSPKTYMAGQENMYIEGTSIPDSLVTVFLKKDSNEIKKWETSSDKDGQWFLSVNDFVKPGIYNLSAIVQDARGAISNNSDQVKLEVLFNGLNIGGLMITFRNLILVLFFILLLVTFYAVYIISKNKKDKKTLQKETKEALDSLAQNFAVLDAELRKKIEFFDQEPGFNQEEKKMYEEIKKSLEAAAVSISKEIKDIEKGIK
jgi:hypothetical protein